MKNSIRRLFRWLPLSWKSWLEFHFDKSLGKEFVGPFNGQVFRQGIFRDLMKLHSFEAIIETGTFRGTTTSFMAAESGKPVFTVEAERRYWYYAKRNLKRYKQVQVRLGDSRKFIQELAADQTVPRQNIFFYLDAHWHDDLPLFKEIELIGKSWNNVVIMIDDFEVPDDNGYEFDNYGEGKKLSLEYILPLLENKWTVFFPARNSKEETGFKRGSVILVDNGLAEKVKQLDCLRVYHPVKSVLTK